MTAIRHNTATEDRLLDAARESILLVGWKRTTLTEVARRAGLSRMTVYRTYADMTGLLGDLMTREWLQMLAELNETAAEQPWPERIGAQVVATVRALRANPLFHRIVDVDPELLLPYLLDRRGRSQEAVLDLLADRIAEGQAEGGLRRGDPVLLARAIVLATHGFVLSAHTMTDGVVTATALDQELAELVRRCLAP